MESGGGRGGFIDFSLSLSVFLLVLPWRGSLPSSSPLLPAGRPQVHASSFHGHGRSGGRAGPGWTEPSRAGIRRPGGHEGEGRRNRLSCVSEGRERARSQAPASPVRPYLDEENAQRLLPKCAKCSRPLIDLIHFFIALAILGYIFYVC